MMKRENLTSLLKKADKEELISLIERMADADSTSEHVLLEYCKGKASPKEKKLLHDRQLEMKWDSIRGTVDTANEYGGCSDDDEDDVYDTLYEMQELVKKDSTSWDIRRDILDEILEQAGYGNSGFDDILYETAIEFCQEKEEKHYLAEYLTQHGGYYWRDRGAAILQEIGAEDEYLSFRMQHLESEMRTAAINTANSWKSSILVKFWSTIGRRPNITHVAENGKPMRGQPACSQTYRN